MIELNEIIRVYLIQCDWCPHKKRRVGHRPVCRKDHKTTQGRWPSASHGKQPHKKPGLGHLVSRIVRKDLSVVISCLSGIMRLATRADRQVTMGGSSSLRPFASPVRGGVRISASQAESG